MIWRILLLGLLGFFADRAMAEGPSEFYVVSHSDSDGGEWDYRILDVRPYGLGSLVRYILITPVRLCFHSLAVRAAEIRLPNISPAQLAADQNPCDVAPPSKDVIQPRNVVSMFSITRAGIAAKCGFEEKLGVPPHLGELTKQIINRAFGGRDLFWGISEEEDLEPQREGAKLLPEMVAGRFDGGLNAVFRDDAVQKLRSFRDLLRDYSGIVKASEFVDRRLVNTNSYRFTKYVEPDYPLLGVAALVLGTVDLQLRVDTSTGEVQNVTVMRGQAELADRASKAAQNWQFEPTSIDSQSITVAVDFKFRCP